MVKIKYMLIGLAILITGIWLALHFFESEERKVKKQFALLSEWVSKDPKEDSFAMARRVRSIGTLFGENCVIKTPFDSFSGRYKREEIPGYAVRGRSYFSSLDLKFYDLGISFPEKGMADVTVTARLTGTSSAGEQVEETRELKCILKKPEKKWLFSEIEVVEVLKR
jgi:hypothetical protein